MCGFVFSGSMVLIPDYRCSNAEWWCSGDGIFSNLFSSSKFKYANNTFISCIGNTKKSGVVPTKKFISLIDRINF